MTTERSGSAFTVPIVVVAVSAAAFGALFYAYWKSTESTRAIAGLPAVADYLAEDFASGGEPQLYRHHATKPILDDPGGTAPGLVELYDRSKENVNLRLLCMQLLVAMIEQEADVMDDAAMLQKVADMVIAAATEGDERQFNYAVWAARPDRLGPELVKPFGEMMVTHLAEGPASRDPGAIRQGLRLLQATQDPEAVVYYEKVLARSDDQQIRMDAVNYMKEIKDPKTVYALGRLFTDRDPGVAELAIQSMKEFPSQGAAVDEVMNKALHDEKAEVRQAAVGIMDALEMIDKLKDALSNDDEAVAVEAADRLSRRRKTEHPKVMERPGDIRDRMLDLVAKLKIPASFLRMGPALAPFVGQDQRDRFFDDYLNSGPDPRIVYVYLLGVLAEQQGRNDEERRADFLKIRDRWIDDLKGLREDMKPLYKAALGHIEQHAIEAEFEAWDRYREAEKEFEAAKARCKEIGDVKSTFTEAERAEIEAHLVKARQAYEWIQSSKNSGDRFERELDRIKELSDGVRKQVVIEDH
ncbi:MAG: HEAT repeat domain-containing protein [Planctomycetes bacterium]|nr:HEAT repeat domain-containing protein [Planctomycetota bacterium]